MGRLLLAQQLEDHRQDAVQRAGRLALRVGQGGQGVKGTVQIR